MRPLCISMLEFLQTIRFMQNFFAFLCKLTRQLSRRKETAKNAENFLGIWTANICQRHDIRTPIDGIRGMVEISRHYADDERSGRNAVGKSWIPLRYHSREIVYFI